MTVDLDLNSGLTALLQDLATGKHIPSIELKGASADGHTVYDLKLGEVVLTTYHDTNSGHDMLSFSYQQVSLTTTPQNPDGTLGTPVTLQLGHRHQYRRTRSFRIPSSPRAVRREVAHRPTI